MFVCRLTEMKRRAIVKFHAHAVDYQIDSYLCLESISLLSDTVDIIFVYFCTMFYDLLFKGLFLTADSA